MTPRTKAKGLKYSDAAHRYWLDGKPVPGVTTILGCLDKPAIPRWAASQVAEYVADNPNGVEELRHMGRNAMVAALKQVPWQKRDDAAAKGSEFHEYAEIIANGGEADVPDALVGHVEAALSFFEDWQIEPVLVEQSVGSREHRYAGRLDLVARYKHPLTGHEGVGIMDWKSGRAIYWQTAFQLAAYANAEFYGEQGDENPLPEIDMTLGVHIRSDDYTAYPLEFGPHVYEEFLAIRKVADIKKRAEGDYRSPGTGYVGVPIERVFP